MSEAEVILHLAMYYINNNLTKEHIIVSIDVVWCRGVGVHPSNIPPSA